jgi:predicted ATPase
MIVEDAHWVDPTSLEVFGRTADHIKPLPVLLIVTFRPEFNAPWAGRSHVTSLALNRLGERGTAAIIARIVGNKDLPADVTAEIVERTDGIPLFVEEMTKAVLEAESEGEARQTAAAMPSSALAVPASLHARMSIRHPAARKAVKCCIRRLGDVAHTANLPPMPLTCPFPKPWG